MHLWMDKGLCPTCTVFMGKGDGFSKTSNTSQGLSPSVTSKLNCLSSSSNKPLQCRCHKLESYLAPVIKHMHGFFLDGTVCFLGLCVDHFTWEPRPGVQLSPFALWFPRVRVAPPYWAQTCVFRQPLLLRCKLVKYQRQY